MSYSAITLSRGDVVYRPGDDGDCMYLVQEGAVEMLDGGEDGSRMAHFERGDFFGENSIIDHARRAHTLRVTETTRLIKIDRGGLAHMLRRNPEITVRMLRKLAKRLADTESKLQAILTQQTRLDDTVGAMPLSARLHFEGKPPRMFEVSDEGATIGRADPLSGIAPDIDLTPMDPQLTTSRRHAAMTVESGVFNLVEVRATNGTFVDGRRLRPERPTRLLGGERLVFGGVALRFELMP